MDLKIGDIVCLNSDVKRTILMTVNGSGTSTTTVVCFWFDGFDLKHGVFNKAALTKIDK